MSREGRKGSELKFSPDEIAKDKFYLLTKGLKITEEATKIVERSTLEFAFSKGIAGGIDLILPYNIHVSAPILEKYTHESGYKLTAINSTLYLSHHGIELYPVEFISSPQFPKNEKGIILSKYGKIYTDRLGISIVKGCKFAMLDEGCRFCEIGKANSISFNSIQDVKQLIDYCEANELINFKHILLTGGCAFDEMWSKLISFIKEISAHTNRPIYYMTPPVSEARLEEVKECGVSEIGMNIELWDRNIAKEVMPGKGKFTREEYIQSLRQAVSLFGSSGEVRSLLIVGVEPVENTYAAVDYLSKMKVMPILSPLRLLKNTEMKNYVEPEAATLFEVWKECQKICEKNEMTLGPTCKACQNNTITVPVNSLYKYY
ncbi:radical SAM protein [Desulfovibrio sp. JC022]|uniref:radical SAM protein n=1 Tax=Desulfovibrio sp. JC022 TaxID=2593642 RepID=UPI0013D6D137|nr:radical SAM protein [Desulfovibrio sp. JC022]NDV22940.1 hypothetical protein [Desulfovibrio sp. JC022]